MGGECVELDYFPNATVAEYGEVGGDNFFDVITDYTEQAHKIRAEIYARGPVATTINASPLRDYEGGILDDDTASQSTNHIVSIVGFGKDKDTGTDYWIIRNSWGEVSRNLDIPSTLHCRTWNLELTKLYSLLPKVLG